jgi:hypothetical protein
MVMVMGRVRFTERVLVVAETNGLGSIRYSSIYEIGDIATLPEPSCQRWIRRGKAVRVPDLEADDGVQAEAETQTPLAEGVADEPAGEPEPEPEDATETGTVAEPGGAGSAGGEETAADAAAVDDSAAVAGRDRRPRRRRAEPDPA